MISFHAFFVYKKHLNILKLFTAFVIPDYDYHNTTYGSWAESSWPRETSSRMFLKASPSREAAYLSLGIIKSLIIISITKIPETTTTKL